jgi:hypothetical protein
MRDSPSPRDSRSAPFPRNLTRREGSSPVPSKASNPDSRKALIMLPMEERVLRVAREVLRENKASFPRDSRRIAVPGTDQKLAD